VSIAQRVISQAVEPRGALGWVMAWAYRVSSLLFRSQYGTIAGLLDLRPEDDVLDLACGSGMFLQKYTSRVHRIAGLDHSEIQIRMACKRNRERIAAGTAEIVEGDAAALPWENGGFSAVTCDSLQGFAEPLRSLKEMHRVIRPGGRAVLAFNYYPDEEKARKAEQRWGFPVWNETEVGKLMSDAGFSHVSISHDKTVMFAKAVKQ
jgi:ubiquinone/menaquinone biosynthesis C-methylase UbiE